MARGIRNHTIFVGIVFLLLLFFVPHALGAAHDDEDDLRVPFLTIPELCNAPEEYDGILVEFAGEAVGDILNGDDSGHKWVNLSSEGSTIGVYVSNEDAEKVGSLGAYNVTGTVLNVRGIYHVSCQNGHDGELDVHATDVTIKSVGGAGEPDSIDPPLLILGLAAVVLGLSLHALHLHLRRRRG